MNIDSFLAHYGLSDNPFDAEEARHDRVFSRMGDTGPCHPDFSKILGQLNPPSTSIVFGEKGSGKTAIRFLIARQIEAHNRAHDQGRSLLVVYDNLNPYLDRVISRRKGRRTDTDKLLKDYRLQDHQDAILSLAVTQLVDMIVDPQSGGESAAGPAELNGRIKAMPRRLRADLAVLAALYDQPPSGSILTRWRRLFSKLRLGWLAPFSLIRPFAIVLSLAAIGLVIGKLIAPDDEQAWLVPLLGFVFAGAIVLWGVLLARTYLTAGRIRKQMPAIDRPRHDLHDMLQALSRRDLDRGHWPLPVNAKVNGRYDVTARLVEVLAPLGYASITVVIDRIDEPTAINGRSEQMQSVVWPMLDNKFLQQDGIGFKLLMPIELRHLLHRETADFFQHARLDKQNLIDRLTWSGATLYDLCSSRLRACCERHGEEPISLTDLFEPDVTREMIVDALDQMHQPRDAFKFLYSVMQEHCRMVPEDQPRHQIARLTLETVRRSQSERVQDLYRGVSPA